MSAISITVESPDQVGEARRAAVAMAHGLGFDEPEAARVALVVTECATNLWKHGGGGEILLIAVHRDPSPCMEVLALDKGRGMDLERSFRDGYSTSGSPGTGLGAIRRVSAFTDAYTQPDHGTALLARFYRQPPRHRAEETGQLLEWGAVCVPLRGETACGDGFAVREFPGFALVMVVDGLGHGPVAAECAAAACSALDRVTGRSPAAAMELVHEALHSTRGAAVTIATLDYESRKIRAAGIGNVGGFIFDNIEARHLATQPGIAGSDIRNVREYTYEWPSHSHVLLYSDGISTHWSLAAYYGLLSRDTSLIAGVLYRDWKRSRDDATVLVIREKSTS
ncbi:MAG TPA: ATP-binding SpoIIE family protein phosphatase [Candidatus Limnocylindrales bacterium]|nr:ATP-binding SpoIIE family protein phosphatase [Candidatus Limnocylindrales bacterium]